MEWNRNKPAYNRRTLDEVQQICSERNHKLVSFEFPNVTVECHCGNIFTKTLRAYSPQKNGCKECDSRRKRQKRPEHSDLMKRGSHFHNLNEEKRILYEELYPPKVIVFLYGQKLTIDEICDCLGCGSVWVSKSLKRMGVPLRVKNDYSNPTELPRVRAAISRNCIERCAGGWDIKEQERHLPGILYLVRYLDEAGTHFKLGITRRTLQERLGDKLVSIIHLHYATLGECFDLEQSLLKWARSEGYRYSSPTTTELLHPSAIPHILSELSLRERG